MGGPRVDVGLSLGSFSDLAAEARLYESLGYGFVHVGEHVHSRVSNHNAFVSLGVAAGATTRVGLMSAVTLLPLYPAALAAKMAAMLQVASGGRFRMGVGIGGELPAEFAACGVEVTRRGARADEAIEVVRRLWGGADVGFHGRFNDFDGVTLAPRPPAGQHPPIFVSGRRDAAVARAARLGDAWFPYLYSPELLERSISLLHRCSADAGRAEPPAVGAWLPISCDPDPAVARRRVVEGLSQRYGQDFGELVDRYALHGTPERCRRRLAEYLELGVGTVALVAFGPEEDRPRHAARIAAEVVGEHLVAA